MRGKCRSHVSAIEQSSPYDVARARFITEQSNPKMHKKDTVIATLGADPEQVEIRSKGGGREGRGGLCCSRQKVSRYKDPADSIRT